MHLAFAVHRLPGRQQQDELAGHARLAAQQALAVAGLWRHHLPGADDSRGERADDAGGGGGGYVVLGAGAQLTAEVYAPPAGAALCCEEAIAAEDNLQPYRPLRSTRLLLQDEAAA